MIQAAYVVCRHSLVEVVVINIHFKDEVQNGSSNLGLGHVFIKIMGVYLSDNGIGKRVAVFHSPVIRFEPGKGVVLMMYIDKIACAAIGAGNDSGVVWVLQAI